MDGQDEDLGRRVGRLSREIGLWSTSSESEIGTSYLDEYGRKQSIVSLGKPEMADVISLVLEEFLPARGRVLDLGSGTGFLAEVLLASRKGITLTCADVSEEMLGRARTRLERFGDRVSFASIDFNSVGWEEGLGGFDAVVSLSALHRLRDERTPGFCAEVRVLLADGGWFLNGAPFRSRFAPVLDIFELQWALFVRERGRELRNRDVPVDLLREFKRAGRAARDAGALVRFNRLDASTWCSALLGAGFKCAEPIWRCGASTVLGASV